MCDILLAHFGQEKVHLHGTQLHILGHMADDDEYQVWKRPQGP